MEFRSVLFRSSDTTTVFDFTPGGYGSAFTLKNGDQNDSGDLDPGTYSVAETPEAGWDLTSATCDDGSNPSSIGLAAGETVTCTFTNQKDANIIVKKVTDPVSDTTTVFDFTPGGYGSAFTLKNGDQNDSGDLDPGTYSVAETPEAGWDLTSATCDDGSNPSSIGLAAGETVTCTFTNQKDANIIVKKVTDPVSDTTTVFDFTPGGYGSAFTLKNGDQNDSGDLDPGTYSVAETPEAGWDLTSATCDDGSNPSSIGLAAGETVTCTFTNQKDANIIVKKVTDPVSDTTTVFDFTPGGYGSAFTLKNGDQNDSGDLDPGTYSVAETPEAGWDLTSATCDDGSNPSSIGLAAGETVTCTFTNQKDANIIVKKVTDPVSDTTTVFDFTPGGYGSAFTLKNGDQNDSGDLDPGTYSVAETPEAGWDLTSATCDDGSNPSSIGLAAGE